MRLPFAVKEVAVSRLLPPSIAPVHACANCGIILLRVCAARMTMTGAPTERQVRWAFLYAS